MGNAKTSLSDVVNKLLGPVIFSLVLLLIWSCIMPWICPLPSVEKMQEAVVRELRAADRGDAVTKREKQDRTIRYSYDKQEDVMFISDGVGGINLDRRNRTVKIHSADYVYENFKRLWAGWCSHCFAAAVMLAVMAFASSRDWGLYISLFCAAIIAAMYLYPSCAQYRICSTDNAAAIPERVASEKWAEVREILRAAPETGFATIHGVRFFIGKKRNFGIDFAQLPAGEDRFVYVLDGASEKQLKEFTRLNDFEKLDDGVYRIRHTNTAGLRRLFRVTHAIFAAIFALLLAACAVTLAVKIIRRRSVKGDIS